MLRFYLLYWLYFLYFLFWLVVQTVGIWHAIPWASDKQIVEDAQEKSITQDTEDADCDRKFDESKAVLETKLLRLRRSIHQSDMQTLQGIAYGIAELEQIERNYAVSHIDSRRGFVVAYARHLNNLRKAIDRTDPRVSSAAMAVGNHVQQMVDELPRTVSRRWSEVGMILSGAESGYPFWRAMKKIQWANQFSRELLPGEVEKYLASTVR